jgi:hypothetical protein
MGTLAVGTTQATLSLTTDENASCRYATSAGVAYASMPNAFTTTGFTTHSTTVTGLSSGGSYNYFVRCRDGVGNANTTDFTISFSVAAPTGGGRIAFYGFSEGSGTSVNDSSSNGHTGTIAGATWSTQGRFGNALSFDGLNDWVTVNSTSLLNLTTGMTLEAWVYPTTIPTTYTAVAIKENGTDLSYALGAGSPSGPPGVFATTQAEIAASGPTTLAVNTWSHLAATYDGTMLRLYINGGQVAQAAMSGAMAVSSGALRLGGNSPNGYWFQGRLDELRIYNRALTQAEIQTDMNTPIN